MSSSPMITSSKRTEGLTDPHRDLSTQTIPSTPSNNRLEDLNTSPTTHVTLKGATDKNWTADDEEGARKEAEEVEILSKGLDTLLRALNASAVGSVSSQSIGKPLMPRSGRPGEDAIESMRANFEEHLEKIDGILQAHTSHHYHALRSLHTLSDRHKQDLRQMKPKLELMEERIEREVSHVQSKRRTLMTTMLHRIDVVSRQAFSENARRAKRIMDQLKKAMEMVEKPRQGKEGDEEDGGVAYGHREKKDIDSLRDGEEVTRDYKDTTSSSFSSTALQQSNAKIHSHRRRHLTEEGSKRLEESEETEEEEEAEDSDGDQENVDSTFEETPSSLIEDCLSHLMEEITSSTTTTRVPSSSSSPSLSSSPSHHQKSRSSLETTSSHASPSPSSSLQWRIFYLLQCKSLLKAFEALKHKNDLFLAISATIESLIPSIIHPNASSSSPPSSSSPSAPSSSSSTTNTTNASPSFLASSTSQNKSYATSSSLSSNGSSTATQSTSTSTKSSTSTSTSVHLNHLSSAFFAPHLASIANDIIPWLLEASDRCLLEVLEHMESKRPQIVSFASPSLPPSSFSIETLTQMLDQMIDIFTSIGAEKRMVVMMRRLLFEHQFIIPLFLSSPSQTPTTTSMASSPAHPSTSEQDLKPRGWKRSFPKPFDPSSLSSSSLSATTTKFTTSSSGASLDDIPISASPLWTQVLKPILDWTFSSPSFQYLSKTISPSSSASTQNQDDPSTTSSSSDPNRAIKNRLESSSSSTLFYRPLAHHISLRSKRRRSNSKVTADSTTLVVDSTSGGIVTSIGPSSVSSTSQSSPYLSTGPIWDNYFPNIDTMNPQDVVEALFEEAKRTSPTPSSPSTLSSHKTSPHLLHPSIYNLNAHISTTDSEETSRMVDSSSRTSSSPNQHNLTYKDGATLDRHQDSLMNAFHKVFESVQDTISFVSSKSTSLLSSSASNMSLDMPPILKTSPSPPTMDVKLWKAYEEALSALEIKNGLSLASQLKSLIKASREAHQAQEKRQDLDKGRSTGAKKTPQMSFFAQLKESSFASIMGMHDDEFLAFMTSLPTVIKTFNSSLARARGSQGVGKQANLPSQLLQNGNHVGQVTLPSFFYRWPVFGTLFSEVVWKSLQSALSASPPPLSRALFSPGAPHLMRRHMMIFTMFFARVETSMPHLEHVINLRSDPSLTLFWSQWNFAGYVSLLTKQIVEQFEEEMVAKCAQVSSKQASEESDKISHKHPSPTSPSTPLHPSSSSHAMDTREFILPLIPCLESSLERTWSPTSFVPNLSHRFLKLSFQLFHHFGRHVHGEKEEEMSQSVAHSPSEPSTSSRSSLLASLEKSSSSSSSSSTSSSPMGIMLDLLEDLSRFHAKFDEGEGDSNSTPGGGGFHSLIPQSNPLHALRDSHHHQHSTEDLQPEVWAEVKRSLASSALQLLSATASSVSLRIPRMLQESPLVVAFASHVKDIGQKYRFNTGSVEIPNLPSSHMFPLMSSFLPLFIVHNKNNRGEVSTLSEAGNYEIDWMKALESDGGAEISLRLLPRHASVPSWLSTVFTSLCDTFTTTSKAILLTTQRTQAFIDRKKGKTTTTSGQGTSSSHHPLPQPPTSTLSPAPSTSSSSDMPFNVEELQKMAFSASALSLGSGGSSCAIPRLLFPADASSPTDSEKLRIQLFIDLLFMVKAALALSVPRESLQPSLDSFFSTHLKDLS